VRDADEIVVGSRGLGRIRGALGSVSQELLREAARPVLVIGRDAAAVLGTPALAS
jgi:nucleotide-binding universal stress UspA family protein